MQSLRITFDSMITIFQTLQLAHLHSTPSPKCPRKRGRDAPLEHEHMGKEVDAMTAADAVNRTAVPTAFVSSICGGTRSFNEDTASRSALCLDYMRKFLSDEERNFLKSKNTPEMSPEYTVSNGLTM